VCGRTSRVWEDATPPNEDSRLTKTEATGTAARQIHNTPRCGEADSSSTSSPTLLSVALGWYAPPPAPDRPDLGPYRPFLRVSGSRHVCARYAFALTEMRHLAGRPSGGGGGYSDGDGTTRGRIRR